MPVTKEMVEAKAKELGLTLTPEQVLVFTTLGVLPTKGESGSQPGGEEEPGNEEDDKDLTAGMKKRLEKERLKREKLATEHAENLKKLKAFEDEAANKTRTESEKKGEYDKLLAETKASKEKLDSSLKTVQESYKQKAIESEVRNALLEAGVPSDRLPKAVKLFLLEKSDDVKFEWSDAEKFESEIDGVTEAVESFKKDNDFLFGESENTNQNNGTGFNPLRRQPDGSKSKEKTAESRLKELERKCPAIAN